MKLLGNAVRSLGSGNASAFIVVSVLEAKKMWMEDVKMVPMD